MTNCLFASCGQLVLRHSENKLLETGASALTLIPMTFTKCRTTSSASASPGEKHGV